jgi:hypothetical protein
MEDATPSICLSMALRGHVLKYVCIEGIKCVIITMFLFDALNQIF